MEKSRKFRVLRVGSVVELHGVMGDSTEFEPYADLFAESDSIDFAGLESASFSALNKFIQFQAGVCTGAVYLRVPEMVFWNLSFLADEGFQTTVSSLFALSYDVGKANNSHTAVRSLDHQVAQSEALVSQLLEHGDFGPVLSRYGRRWLYSLRHLCHALLPPGTDIPPRYPNPHVANHLDEVSFWSDYATFSTSVADIARNGMMSLADGLLVKISDLLRRIENTNRSCAIIGTVPATPHGSHLDDIVQVMRSLDERIGKIQLFYRGLLLDIHEFLCSDDRDFQRFLALAASLGQLTRENLVDLVGSIESLGGQLTESILGIFSSSAYLKLFKTAFTDGVDPESLQEIRDAMLIMDILSQGDTNATLDLIIEELGVMEQELQDCVIDLQAFDVTRQILEHRIRESDTIDAMLNERIANRLSWQDIRDTILSLAGEKLVTDQEKGAYKHFFRDHIQDDSGLLSAGEVNFF